ncbi:hypothetical protein BPNPMPFG_007205 (plasmid) [Mesorhizobium sp. AR07]|uniref:hypothetical protein n=1 Tax=Mesorhizobium sp. AR07 TaxID=2865838 RepID=UPI00215E5C54|nr:hypothetical protein [Mesorhizobium sp. AR07]UVK48731.1 hypothetical protein BPNPMPFG_007205 [Mesorhizobium sp. AR07]
MTTKMTHAIRMELANAVRVRYAAAANKDKRRILEEFIADFRGSWAPISEDRGQ